jgi:hypothetical protein
MAGMPSAYGGEWRGRCDGAHKRYQENLEKIDWKNDIPISVVSPILRAPASCSACSRREGCSDDCANGSQACKDRLGL